ncbi:MAG: M15 family metallopeptidase [Meiothermus silvanus]|nr:M15 family metallopeptidase [Allomeiothermus silvanus]
MDYYGDPLGKTGKSLSNGLILPDREWERQNIVLLSCEHLPGWPKFPGPNGPMNVRGVRVHRLVAPVLKATWAEVVRRGFHRELRSYDGAYLPRHMLYDPRRPLSVHAFGAALDFDARWNGYGLPYSRIAISRNVVAVFKFYGWQWGGDWNPTDGMHFQWTLPL